MLVNGSYRPSGRSGAITDYRSLPGKSNATSTPIEGQKPNAQVLGLARRPSGPHTEVEGESPETDQPIRDIAEPGLTVKLAERISRGERIERGRQVAVCTCVAGD